MKPFCCPNCNFIPCLPLQWCLIQIYINIIIKNRLQNKTKTPNNIMKASIFKQSLLKPCSRKASNVHKSSSSKVCGLCTMKERSNRASWREDENKIETIVNTTTKKRQDIRMWDMSYCPNLHQKLFLSPLVFSPSSRYPLHSDFFATFN